MITLMMICIGLACAYNDLLLVTSKTCYNYTEILILEYRGEEPAKELMFAYPIPPNTTWQICDLVKANPKPIAIMKRGPNTLLLFTVRLVDQLPSKVTIMCNVTVLELRSNLNKDNSGSSYEIPSTLMVKFTRATYWWNYTAPEVVEVVDEIRSALSEEDNVYEIVMAIREWLIKNMKYTLHRERRGAVEAILSREGDCSEYADIFIALCRAMRLPARRAWGWLVNIRGEYATWLGHTWPEVWVPSIRSWVPIEVTMIGEEKAPNLGEVDTRYLAFLIEDGTEDITLMRIMPRDESALPGSGEWKMIDKDVWLTSSIMIRPMKKNLGDRILAARLKLLIAIAIAVLIAAALVMSSIKQKRAIKAILLLIMLLALVSWTSAVEANDVEVRGKVVDIYGNPIENATIVVLFGEERLEVSTNEAGEFNINLSSPSLLYIYHVNEEGIHDYVPVTIYVDRSSNITVTLHPGALLRLEGQPFSIELASLARVSGIVVLAERPMPLHSITSYGTYTSSNVFGLEPNEAVVPANIPFRLKIQLVTTPAIMPMLKNVTMETTLEEMEELLTKMGRRLTFRSTRTIEIPANGSYVVRQGALIVLDVSKIVLELDINGYADILDRLDGTISDLERLGLYMYGDRLLLEKAKERLEEAKVLVEKDLLAEAYVKLREVYLSVLRVYSHVKDLLLEENRALFGITLFISLTSFMVAALLFEDRRRRAFVSALIAATIVIALYVLQPLMRLMKTETLIMIISSSISFPPFLSLILHIEPTSRVGMALALAKRNIRRWKLRSMLILISTTLIVASLVSLTSASVTYTTITTRINLEIPKGSLLLKGISSIEALKEYARRLAGLHAAEVFPVSRLDMSLMEFIKTNFRVREVLPMVITLPTMRPLTWLESAKGSLPVFGIIGLDFQEDPIAKVLEEGVIEGNLRDLENSRTIAVSSIMADVLDLEVGSVVEIFNMKYRVVAIIDDNAVVRTKDLDGMPILPCKLMVSRVGQVLAFVVTWANPYEVILINWRDALKFPFTIISRLYITTDQGRDLKRLALVMTEAYNLVSVYATEEGVFVSYLGPLIQMHGLGFIIMPLVLAFMVIATSSLGIAFERRGEAKVMSLLGLSPSSLIMVYATEYLILGMLGGITGYFLALLWYRAFRNMGIMIGVVEKASSTWALISMGMSSAITLTSSILPLIVAVRKITASKMLSWRPFILDSMKGIMAVELPVAIRKEVKDSFMKYMKENLRRCIESRSSFKVEEIKTTQSGDLRLRMYSIEEGATVECILDIKCIEEDGGYRALVIVTPITPRIRSRFKVIRQISMLGMRLRLRSALSAIRLLSIKGVLHSSPSQQGTQ